MSEKLKQEDINGLIAEAVNKLVKGINGIETLHNVTMHDFEWTVVKNGITYKIYFEQFRGENNENKN